MFKITVATEKDIPLIQHIAENTWWPTYTTFLPAEQIRYMLDTIYSSDNMLTHIRNGSQIFLLLTDESGAQGFAAYGPRTDDPTVFKLYKLYVLPTAHGKGYGRALVDEVKTRLVRENVHALDLNVNRHNPALKFYERIGFKMLREEDIPIGPYWMNDYVLRSVF